MAWNVSTVNEDGVPPVSLSITGAGVKDGELSLSAGSLAQLSVAGSSSKADMWWSDGAAVAVSGTGNVYAVQAGTAKVSAKVDGKTVSVTVTTWLMSLIDMRWLISLFFGSWSPHLHCRL